MAPLSTDDLLMLDSPPPRRVSISSISTKNPHSKREETLINAYEAEEERIINQLSRKLERLREEKVELENALEAESEAHVNRLSRELSALRLVQQQQQIYSNSNGYASLSGVPSTSSTSPEFHSVLQPFIGRPEPTSGAILEAMRSENEQLRNRLSTTERDYIRVTRLNDIYREELIQHRRRLGLPLDNLIGLQDADPYSHPILRRHEPGSPSQSPLHSPAARPLGSALHLPSHVTQSSLSHRSTTPSPVAIPRPSSAIHIKRPPPSFTPSTSEVSSPTSDQTPSTTSPSESSLPASPFSPGAPGSLALTNGTTPASSASLTHHLTMGPTTVAPLTYPSVPPPSLSSSPVRVRVAETGSLMGHRNRSRSRGGGSSPQSRSRSQSLAATAEALSNMVKTSAGGGALGGGDGGELSEIM